jgi:hypothetical protein
VREKSEKRRAREEFAVDGGLGAAVASFVHACEGQLVFKQLGVVQVKKGKRTSLSFSSLSISLLASCIYLSLCYI